jgi:hypothetical protein
LALGRDRTRQCEREYAETGDDRHMDRAERWRDAVDAATPEGTE